MGGLALTAINSPNQARSQGVREHMPGPKLGLGLGLGLGSGKMSVPLCMCG